MDIGVETLAVDEVLIPCHFQEEAVQDSKEERKAAQLEAQSSDDYIYSLIHLAATSAWHIP